MNICAHAMAPARILLLTLTMTAGVTLGDVVSALPGQTQDASRRFYDRVMDEFRQRDYEAALAGFRLFLEIHGQSALASHAQYWLGECQYRMGRYKEALTSFYNLVSYHPLSQKRAGATLKIAQIYTKLGDKEIASMMFERVVDEHPDSPEAEVARKALEATAPKEATGTE